MTDHGGNELGSPTAATRWSSGGRAEGGDGRDWWTGLNGSRRRRGRQALADGGACTAAALPGKFQPAARRALRRHVRPHHGLYGGSLRR